MLRLCVLCRFGGDTPYLGLLARFRGNALHLWGCDDVMTMRSAFAGCDDLMRMRPAFAGCQDLAASRSVFAGFVVFVATRADFESCAGFAPTRSVGTRRSWFWCRDATRAVCSTSLAAASNAWVGVGAARDTDSAALAMSSIMGLPASNMLSRSTGPTDVTVSRKGFWAKMIFTFVGWQ